MADNKFNLQLLRNSTIAETVTSKSDAISELKDKLNSLNRDGQPVLYSYQWTKGGGDSATTVKGVLLGVKTNGITQIFDQQALEEAINLLNSDNTVEGSVSYTVKDALDKLTFNKKESTGNFINSITQTNGLVSVTFGEVTSNGGAIKVASTDEGINLSVQTDDTIVINENGQLHVDATALSVDGDKNAIKVEDAVVKLITNNSDKILTDNDGLMVNLSLEYGDYAVSGTETIKAIMLYGKTVGDKKQLVDFISASDFIKDGMIDSVSYDGDTHKITIKWNTDAGKTDTVLDLSDLVDDFSGAVASAKTTITEKNETSGLKITKSTDASDKHLNYEIEVVDMASATALASVSESVNVLKGDANTTGSVANTVNAAINALEYIDAAVTNQYVDSVNENGGKILVHRTPLPVISVDNATNDSHIKVTTTNGAVVVESKDVASATTLSTVINSLGLGKDGTYTPDFIVADVTNIIEEIEALDKVVYTLESQSIQHGNGIAITTTRETDDSEIIHETKTIAVKLNSDDKNALELDEKGLYMSTIIDCGTY